ncbi:MAG TPA: MotA/TolQ/ExbB proton channel family protein [Afifellaceae bacterium]|nr:MotA/TolQ/ExbB proton channel family protein [Afifellaceae bacterium]
MTRPHANTHIFPQIWLLLASLMAFGTFVIVDLGYMEAVIDADRSRLSVLIVLLFLGASAHAAWHIFAASGRIKATREYRRSASAEAAETGSHEIRDARSFVRAFAHSLTLERAALPAAGGDNQSNVLEIYADRLRSAVEIGWYIVDILVRLGLVGTIIGFILILGTLSDGPEVTADNIQNLLISMSGGMGIALYTTLTGLITASLLGMQYMVLGRCVESLIAELLHMQAVEANPESAT